MMGMYAGPKKNLQGIIGCRFFMIGYNRKAYYAGLIKGSLTILAFRRLLRTFK